MINLPNLPEKEELEFKEKEFLLSLYEQFQRSSKIWFVVLGVLLVLALPAKFVLQGIFASALIKSYRPPVVNLQPYIPQELQVLRTEILSVSAGSVSVLAQLLNPNRDISAREFTYRFVLKDGTGAVLSEVPGEGYLLSGESRFLLLPLLSLSPLPKTAELVLEQVRWTRRQPEFEVRLEVLQKNTGYTPEGKFFVEGLVRNLQNYQIKKVELSFIVFDQSNRNIVGVNSSVITDLVGSESRYFRVLWPSGKRFAPGQVEVIPDVNLLAPGLILEQQQKIPVR